MKKAKNKPAVQSNLEKVAEFHRVFGLPITATPGLAEDRVDLRWRLIEEEVTELAEALEIADTKKVAREMADVLYVVYGAALEFGIPIDDVFAEVHRANMSKLWTLSDAEAALADPNSEVAAVEVVSGELPFFAIARRADGKVLKSPGFMAPQLEQLALW